MHISYNTWKWLLIGSGLALLLMMLAYPFGYDQTVFMVGGEMTVKHGAIPYRDFIDTKPPIIFIIYGISSAIFGHHEWSIRAFDILFQIVTLMYFYRFMKRITNDATFALYSTFLFTLLYVTGGYWMTGQAETFAFLPSLVAVALSESIIHSDKKHFLLGIYAGIACGILFLLKFTLLTVPVGIVFYLLLQKKRDTQFPWIYIAGGVLSFMIICGGYFLYLTQTHSLAHFMESFEWLKKYADLDPLFASHTISERYFNEFPMRIIHPFGLSGIIIGTVGIFLYFKMRVKSTETRQMHSTAFIHLFIQFLLAITAVLYERKFFAYHFARSYWAFAPFLTLGFMGLRDIWISYKDLWKTLGFSERLFRYAAAFLIFTALFFFSTAPRILSQPLHFVLMHITEEDIAQNVQDLSPQYFYKEEQQVADHLRPLMKTDDNIFVWGNSVGIYYFLEKYPTTICMTNTPLITSWTPKAWKDEMLAQLRAKPPLFFIAEFGDDREYISGSKKDSWQHLLEWDELQNFVGTKYEMKEELGHFRIFEKK